MEPAQREGNNFKSNLFQLDGWAPFASREWDMRNNLIAEHLNMRVQYNEQVMNDVGNMHRNILIRAMKSGAANPNSDPD